MNSGAKPAGAAHQITPESTQYISRWTMKNGDEVLMRPIRPEDEPLMIKFHEQLSDHSVYMRYFQPLKLSQRTAHERLTRICFIDYDREIALVVEKMAANGAPEIVAVGRVSKIHGTDEAEPAVVILDAYHHQGLGTELLRRLIDVARAEKIGRLVATILLENREMIAVCKKLGFHLETNVEDQTVQAEMRL